MGKVGGCVEVGKEQWVDLALGLEDEAPDGTQVWVSCVVYVERLRSIFYSV